MILTADWHLTDNPMDEYRWKVFDYLHDLAQKQKDSNLVILGDLTDRKDRHSATLVNRLITKLRLLVDNYGYSITILMGNHDRSISGPPFWQFIDGLESNKLRFITAPSVTKQNELYLPYSIDPVKDWADVKMIGQKVIFMHQTVTGAIGNNGFKLENNKMPQFPRGSKVYSGDIHVPQTIGCVTYVGAPHPIKFGDNYPCRMLRLDATYKSTEFILRTMRKHMLRVSSVAELDSIKCNRDDQACVIYSLPLSAIDNWHRIQDQITAWAETKGIVLASIEADIISTYRSIAKDTSAAKPKELSAADTLRAFAA